MNFDISGSEPNPVSGLATAPERRTAGRFRRIENREAHLPDDLVCILAGNPPEQGEFAPERFLSRMESALWSESGRPDLRKIRWLRGRLAAKEAVRRFMLDRVNLCLSLNEIEILSDQAGRPLAGGAWTGQRFGDVAVSISHTDTVSAAAAGPPGAHGGIGLDVEPVDRVLSERLVERVFSSEERKLLEGAPEEFRRDGWLRLWCAKEAAGKVTGLGLIGQLDTIRVRSIDFEGSVIHVGRTGGDSGSWACFPGGTVPVLSFIYKGLTVGVSLPRVGAARTNIRQGPCLT